MRFWNEAIVTSKDLGERIRLAREKKGLSQEDLAALVKRDQRAVSEYEHGKRRISVTDLPRFAEVLDVPILYFFEGNLSSRDLDRTILEEFNLLRSDDLRHYAIELVRVFRAATS